MAAECGKTIDEGDPEVSEAIDFANYYADAAQASTRSTAPGRTGGADGRHARRGTSRVAIPAGWCWPRSPPGSAVIIKPAPQARRCAAVLVEALLSAGVPAAALQLVNLDEGALGQRLVADPRVGRLILTGAFETAELFRGFRRDLPLLAETSGKNAIVVTPSADMDLAVRDLVRSAFGHAGQKCSAASLAILVGSVATSRRFRAQLVDAVTSLTVAWPAAATSQMGPLIEPPRGKLLRALTTLEPRRAVARRAAPARRNGARSGRPASRTGWPPGRRST